MQRDMRVSFHQSPIHAGDRRGWRVQRELHSAGPDNGDEESPSRLASLIIEENLREKGVGDGRDDPIHRVAIADVRRRIIAYENTLEELRAQDRRRPLSRSRSPSLRSPPGDVQGTSRQGEKNQGLPQTPSADEVGYKFVVIDPARLPERPVGPSRLGVNVVGAFAGLGMGLVFFSYTVAEVRLKADTTTLSKRSSVAISSPALPPENKRAPVGRRHDVDVAVFVEIGRGHVRADAGLVVDQLGNELGAAGSLRVLRTVRNQ